MRLPAEAPLPPGSLLFKELETKADPLGDGGGPRQALRRSLCKPKEAFRGHVCSIRPLIRALKMSLRALVRWLEPNVEIACEVRLFQPAP